MLTALKYKTCYGHVSAGFRQARTFSFFLFCLLFMCLYLKIYNISINFLMLYGYSIFWSYFPFSPQRLSYPLSCVWIIKQESMMQKLKGWSWLEICVYFINFNERMIGSLTRVQIFNWSELNHVLTYESRRECLTHTDLNFWNSASKIGFPGIMSGLGTLSLIMCHIYVSLDAGDSFHLVWLSSSTVPFLSRIDQMLADTPNRLMSHFSQHSEQPVLKF